MHDAAQIADLIRKIESVIEAQRVMRWRILIRGAVQGVGFRPFVYRLADELGLSGWVNNSLQGVCVEVEGGEDRLREFLARIDRDRPRPLIDAVQPHAVIDGLDRAEVEPTGEAGFAIRPSEGTGPATALIMPDLGPCAACVSDVTDPTNRRYRYPFTSCTRCGPRFSIIEALPYDRATTTMKAFAMCAPCRGEYENPLDRRFHAEPNACPACGPRLEYWDADGRGLAARHDALLAAADAIRAGKIVAVKGVGGFQLLVDARDERAVVRLRDRKHRPDKPFALLFPSLDSVESACVISDLEASVLSSPRSPIVLLRARRGASSICPSVAPGNPLFGVMLPSSPLHHLFARELGFPVVATSGNLADDPICTREADALVRFRGLADGYLVHDRPIARHADDSVVRVVMGRELILRRARGYAPLVVEVGKATPGILAVGGHLKNTVALTMDRRVVLSQHVGNLDTEEARRVFRDVISDVERLHRTTPARVACDRHPDDAAARYAGQSGAPTVGVQHHHAHVLSCMADNEIAGPVLGVAWDGTGYGLDGTIWGGEFLLADETAFRRVGHIRTFRLPGAAQAVKEPRRSAIGLLYELFGDEVLAMTHLPPIAAYSGGEARVLTRLLASGVNAPVTSSAGRLFDAVASILGVRQRATFEGQAAMDLEYAADGTATEARYPFRLDERGSVLVADWEPMIRAILDDAARGAAVGRISAAFHNTLAEMMVAVARRVGRERVVLSGGCFQNARLAERAVARLAAEGFRPYWHRRVPPNDGGLALGQVVAALAG
jgi:hydrogenase maturation protein HypF